MSKCHGRINKLPSLADHPCVNGIDDWERYVNVQMDNLCNLYTGDDLMDDVSTVFNEMRFPLPKKRTLYYSSCIHRVSKPDHGLCMAYYLMLKSHLIYLMYLQICIHLKIIYVLNRFNIFF